MDILCVIIIAILAFIGGYHVGLHDKDWKNHDN